jgi:hypothetical protein
VPPPDVGSSIGPISLHYAIGQRFESPRRLSPSGLDKPNTLEGILIPL